MDKRFWAIIGVIIAIFVGILIFTSDDKSTDGSSDTKATSHVKGNTESKVTLIEYGDFQCPVCAQYYPIVEQVVETNKADIAFQFRHLPLSTIHPNAVAAARASEAAADQGKFWEMYNLLFQNQTSWSAKGNARTDFEGFAKQLNLDMDKYEKAYTSREVNSRVNADRAAFRKTKLDESTPTFLLNGKQIKPNSLEEFQKAIDAELKKQGQEKKTATDTPAPAPAQ